MFVIGACALLFVTSMLAGPPTGAGALPFSGADNNEVGAMGGLVVAEPPSLGRMSSGGGGIAAMVSVVLLVTE